MRKSDFIFRYRVRNWPEYNRALVGPFREVFEQAITDPAKRARALLVWFGSGKGPWSGFPSYETLPEALLLEVPASVVIPARKGSDITTEPALAEGAARYLAGWNFRSKRASDIGLVGAGLARTLLEHVERRKDDEDRLDRARRAFR